MIGRARLIPIAFGSLTFAGVLGMTSGNGPGLDPDSMAYVGAATSLAHGRGLRVPLGKWQSQDSTVELTVWPPAFPTAMAIPQTLGVDPIMSARLMLAASAAVTVALTAILLGGVLSLGALLAAIAVILVTPSFIAVHLSVLSEPLFTAALALTLFSMVRRRPGLAALGAALAVMTRYAGASAALAAAIWFLFFEGGDLKRRFTRAAISSAPAALVFTLWMVHSSRVKVVQSGIAVGYYPGIASTLREGLSTVVSGIAPGASVTAGALFAFIAVIAIVALGVSPIESAQKDSTQGENADSAWTRIAAAAGVLVLMYIAVLVCSRLFVGGAIRFDQRILAPAIFLFEVALIPFLAAAFSGRGRIIRSAGAVALSVWMVAAVLAEAPVVQDSIQDGNDFAASDWRESPTTEWIAHEGIRYSIYTNWPAAVFFDAHRHPFDIPASANPDTLARFGKILRSRNGVLAAFNERNFDYPGIDSIAAGASLVKLYSFPDGNIWAPNRSAR